MNLSKKIMLLAMGTLLVSCTKQQARKPISQTSGTFMKESVKRNIKLIAGEEALIDSVIKSNPKVQYHATPKGYWYTYEVKNTTDTLRPKKGDVAFFDYNIKDLNGNVIYSEVELRPQSYLVDKQNILMGLRDGIKLMKKNEKVTFLFPSHLGFGYRGDNDRIGPNLPIVCTVTLKDFKPDDRPKAQPKPKVEENKVIETETKPE
ncbi:MAG: gliding motility-associated peptidyl-prolyl isomerase GldI [Flavobacterium sp.]|nr:MAG: gliding motility-associated peptidyl-prolyl isomerase GldI [Flavobacterium sp.]